MNKSLDVLVREGIISREVAEKLRRNWVTNVDELYARIRACNFFGQESIRNAMSNELGIKPESLEGFKEYIKKYVSPEVVNAEKPREYPLGLRL